MTIIDLNSFPVNERNGTYGGKAGDKEGITINGEYWIVKYPQTAKDIKGVDFCTTAPLSEYIGSHIYQILGIETHETMLGIRNGKLVVACKDFCKKEGALREIRTLKNVYNRELSERLKKFSSAQDKHLIALETMLIHLKYNPMFQVIPDIQTRFWEQFIVDMLINNSDRNDSNWGILYEDGKYRPAPVYANGASFSSKVSDEQLANLLSDEDLISKNASVYTSEGRQIHGKDLVKITDECYLKTALNIIPVIKNKMDEIRSFINDIPEKYSGFDVCSDIRKQFCIKSMELGYEKHLLPVCELAKKRIQAGQNDN